MSEKTSKTAHQEKHGVIKAAEVLAVLGATAAAVAGTYFLYGSKDAGKNRKAVKGWALKAKGEVLEHIEHAKNFDEKAYHDAVSAVMKKYKKLKNIKSADVAAVAKELKKHWKGIKADLKKTLKK